MAGGTVETLPGQGEAMRELEFPPKLVEAQAAFAQELEELLERHRGQWVAYLGSERVTIDKTQAAAYQRCLDLHLSEEEFVVRCIEPGAAATAFHCHYPLPEQCHKD